MFALLMLILVGASLWMLWTISRNTADALDKQTALQYEVVALEKRLDELVVLVRQNLSQGKAPSPGEPSDVVSINQADLKQLTTLPRIGKAMAQRIIEQRPYESLDDLLSVQGITPELMEEIRARLVL